MINSETFVLGTAQAKAGYGITRTKNLNETSFESLLVTASELGIQWIDTAQNYGEAERWIGQTSKSRFKVGSKVSIVGAEMTSLIRSVEKSMFNLGEVSLNVLFAHDWESANVSERRVFVKLRREFPQLKLGVSIYETKTLERLLNETEDVAIVQIPMNLLNQSFMDLVTKCKSYGKETWARSIFLQGVLDFRQKNNPFKQHADIQRLANFCRKFDLSPIEASILFILSSEVDKHIFGVENSKQLTELAQYYIMKQTAINFSDLASSDQLLLDPRRWSQ